MFFFLICRPHIDLSASRWLRGKLSKYVTLFCYQSAVVLSFIQWGLRSQMPKNSNFCGKILENKYYYEKVLLKRFHLNDNTIEFRLEAQKLELHNKKIVPCESTAEEVSFEW